MDSQKWSNIDKYNEFMGKWSIMVAKEFLIWLSKDNDVQKKKWIDIGCGPGSLTFEILKFFNPEFLLGVDPSPDYLPNSSSPNISFQVGSSHKLPVSSNIFDFVVSGLALNFMSDINASIQEMLRVLKPNCCLALYVWDYSGQMDLLRPFWDVAGELKPEAKSLDEGELFPICNKPSLISLFEDNGIKDIKYNEIVINPTFSDFESYWGPFLGGQGPAGSYLISLNQQDQNLLKTKLASRFLNKPLSLKARALAIQGKK